MNRTGKTADKTGVAGRSAVLFSALALVIGLLSVFGAGVAEAQVPANLHRATTTCPTDSSGQTDCPPPTTAGYTPTLTITATLLSTIDVRIKWQACGYPPAAVGVTAQLFIDGQAITIVGGSGALLTGGCTTDPFFDACIPSGTHTAIAEVAGFSSTPQETFTVPAGVVCANPIVSSTPAGTSSSASSGPLAFTGSNIIRLVLAAALLLLLGTAITMATRKRRSHS